MNRKVLIGMSVLTASVVAAPFALAEATDTDNSRLTNNQESTFLKERAQDDVFEWRLGEYAQKHATTDQVRQLGKQMVADHRADLKEIGIFD